MTLDVLLLEAIYCLSVADMGRCHKPKSLMFGKCFLLTGFIK